MKKFSLDNLLILPQELIPTLSENEIKKLLNDSINAYLDKEITLNTLTQTALSIKNHASIPLNELKNDIEDIISLTFVKDMLSDIAENLNDRNYA